MATIRGNRVSQSRAGEIVRDRITHIRVADAAIAGCVVLQPSRAHAQWWSRAPADFEECADAAEKAATKEDKTAQLSECNAKFAGRRKPGGGYTYFDFMQNRNFDIAGPNPTPEEQKTNRRAIYRLSRTASGAAASPPRFTAKTAATAAAGVAAQDD